MEHDITLILQSTMKTLHEVPTLGFQCLKFCLSGLFLASAAALHLQGEAADNATGHVGKRTVLSFWPERQTDETDETDLMRL